VSRREQLRLRFPRFHFPLAGGNDVVDVDDRSVEVRHDDGLWLLVVSVAAVDDVLVAFVCHESVNVFDPVWGVDLKPQVEQYHLVPPDVLGFAVG